MTNREMFLLATSILFASTTAGMALKGIMHCGHHGDRPGFEHRMDGDHGPQGREAHDGPRGPRPDFFAETDTNKDGFVTKEEMSAKQQARLDEMFATVDTNKDGKLSKEEMDKGRDLMRAKWKAKFEADHKADTATPDAAAAPAPAVAQ